LGGKKGAAYSRLKGGGPTPPDKFAKAGNRFTRTGSLLRTRFFATPTCSRHWRAPRLSAAGCGTAHCRAMAMRTASSGTTMSSSGTRCNSLGIYRMLRAGITVQRAAALQDANERCRRRSAGSTCEKTPASLRSSAQAEGGRYNGEDKRRSGTAIRATW